MGPTTPLESVSAPLADWFFICGVDSEQLYWPDEDDASTWASALQSVVAPTIEEDKLAEAEEGRPDVAAVSTPRHAKKSSLNRISRLSDDVRLSMQTIKLVDSGGTASNRSSTTIKAVQVNGSNGLEPSADDAFEKALRKFAADRDSFMMDLSFSAGAVYKPKPRPKTQRIVAEETSNLRSSVGSLRRRISFRDMTSLKRQPSMARQASVRASRRMSNYNSVIPSPQPLNTEVNMHPLKRRFEPVLLDRYPPRTMTEQSKRRVAFPDYVPMFTFPNDINVVSSDERPRSTWHGFAMTAGDNSKLYGICILVWMPLNQKASEELEHRCDVWRKKNMSDEERELASSLGERLAVERAKLSELLSHLPSVPSGTADREALEDEISAVEEKIGLMTDLLRPVRHGAASKIDGLTDGETGFWIPRAYGILGRDASLCSFWKEWLRAVVVPMTNNGVLRVPPSSPKVGIWQPLESYVVNLCAEALSPISSKTQVEVAIRELRLFARKEAINELPGSRNTDLYALFRCLSIPSIIVLFEFLLSESRIILISSHTAMLHLVSKAIIELLYPFTWAGVFIPVLPARLIQALEAPCPYIVGLERRYENVDLPSDDFLIVDLDENKIESTTAPVSLPKQQRRKLASLLQEAAPHHNRFGVPVGAPGYAVESFPFDAFCTENPAVFNGIPSTTSLSKYAGLNSSSFGDNNSGFAPKPPVLNAFLAARDSKISDRPGTTTTLKESPPPSLSPTTTNFPSLSRNDSGFALQVSLREKRSGHGFNDSFSSRRSSSFGMDNRPIMRRPSAPMVPQGHNSNLSVSTVSTDGFGSNYAPSMYAPSSYAQSTLAASTIMPGVLHQPVRDTDTQKWVEGHCLIWRPREESNCTICDEKTEEGCYRCKGCSMTTHSRCVLQVPIVCPAAFHPEQIRAAFVRCFASLLYTYRKYLKPKSSDKKNPGSLFQFDCTGFIKSLPSENGGYVAMLQQTQAFNEFIHERETKPANDPTVVLFDQIIGAKKNRGRGSIFGKASTSFLSDTSDHLWRTASANVPNTRFPGDYRSIITRIPAKLDPTLMKEPRVMQGVPRIHTAKARRKPIPSMLGPNGSVPSSPPSA